MAIFKIMNVLLSDSPQFLVSPAMLHRSDRPVVRGGEGEWVLEGPGAHDFTTFFNAISVGKWKEYTVAREFHLHLELRGAALTVVQTRADSLSWYAEDVPGTEVSLPESDAWQVVDMTLTADDADAIEGFKVVCDGPVSLRNGHYYAVVPDDDVRPVELALCTTTFKKEEFIERNIKLVRDEIIGSDDLISGHFHMHVVDNGRTLDAEALTSPGISVHPNDNAGGAGGFARGMIEAMEQEPKATHVLLMDDDVLVSSESIIRTFNLLSLVSDEYEEAFVSGAMMNMDEPYIRWEEMGFVGFDGAFHPIKPVARMDVLHDVVDNETFDIPSYLPSCDDQEQHYAAWWYCVIPMTQIERNGLPLPVFVRGDDVEYSRRCRPRFITMNGICIWHLSFHMRYNAAQERYQMTRNCFIDQFTSDFAPLSDFEGQMARALKLELDKFNYTNAELILDGFEDFLKGPEWIMQPVAQKAFMDANKNSEKMRPFSELSDEARALGVDLDDITTWKVYRDRPFPLKSKMAFEASRNGNKAFPPSFTEDGKVAVIDVVGWAYPRGKICGAETIVVIDLPNRQGAIRHLDRERFSAVWSRYERDLKEYSSRKDELRQAYSEARPEMISVAFWKRYLGI